MNVVTTSKSERIPTVEVLGTPISSLNMESTLELIQSWLTGSESRLIVTADATALVIAEDKPRFREVLGRASLITADSVGILWAMKRAGCPNPNKVSGVDLVAKLVELSANQGYRIFFLGAEPGVAERAAERFRLQFPGCNIVGTHHGYFPADSDEVVAQTIAKSKPDILFAAMGMPRQEEFILRTLPIVGAKIGMGVGGSFDVFSGKTKRAPVLLQKMRMEWAWRLLLNPSKLSKVKLLPKFVMLILRSKS